MAEHEDRTEGARLAELRARAEAALAEAPGLRDDVALHELNVYQEELRMQNEELRRALIELEAARDRFSDLFDFAPVGYVTLDAEAAEAVVREANLTMTRVLETPRTHIVGSPMVRWIDPRSIASFRHFLATCAALGEGDEAVGEAVLRSAKGGRTPVQLIASRARPEGEGRWVSVAVIDLSELRRGEEALHAEEERRRLALEAARLGTWDLDVRSGELTVDGRFREIFGFVPGQPVDLAAMASRVHPDDRAAWAARNQAAAGPGATGELEHEYRLLLPDGELRWVLSHSHAVFEGEGREWRVARRSGIVMDVTAHRRSEAGLRELAASLERRVAEGTEEATRRARDLRSLTVELTSAEQRERRRLAKLLHDHLQQMLVAAKMRLSRLRPGEDVQERLDEARRLIDDAIAASRDLTAELSPPILSQGTLGEALQWLGRRFESTHGLAVRVEDDGPEPAVSDPVRTFLFQSVRELLFNTVKHSGASEATVRLGVHGGLLAIEVEDRGRGFDPAVVDLKLEEGAGFGLFSIRERLVALLGRLEIESGPGAGARFRLLLPVKVRAGDQVVAPTPTASPPPAPEAGDGVVRVLVVDDHRIVREGLVSMLGEQPGLEVVGEAADGEEAIERAAMLRPEVIVMDVAMPRLDGVEATRRIVQRQPETAVIGLSLHEEDEVARAMLGAGARAYLRKDGPAEELFRVIRSVTGRLAP